MSIRNALIVAVAVSAVVVGLSSRAIAQDDAADLARVEKKIHESEDIRRNVASQVELAKKMAENAANDAKFRVMRDMPWFSRPSDGIRQAAAELRDAKDE